MTERFDIGDMELPDDLRALDEELSSITYEERASFGPELRAELASAWAEEAPRWRFAIRRHLAAAALAGLLEAGSTRWVWFGLALASGVWHIALRKGAGSGKLAAGLTAIASLAAPILGALLSSESGYGLAVTGAVSSSLLLGAVSVTMILGHWYLVDTSLSIAPLRDGARWVSIAIVARWAAVLFALGYGGWEVLRVNRVADFILSTNGLFFMFRALMGLVAPLLLSVLIWQTVKMRSTQSATGLLYVALILVLFGELVSQFLLVRTGFPL